MNSYHLTQWVLFFFFYSFAGWIWESCYVSVRKHRWVNRGFMHGPMLPIYGSGALVVLISTIGVRENVVLIFLFGMTAATLLEYVTGAAMESLFHVRYWDYSNQKLNLHGYICVSSSLCWGCFSVLLVRVCHVPIETVVLKLPLIAADGIAFVLVAVAAADLTQSFNEAMDMKRILAQLEESKAQRPQKSWRSIKSGTSQWLRITADVRMSGGRKQYSEKRHFWSVSISSVNNAVVSLSGWVRKQSSFLRKNCRLRSMR